METYTSEDWPSWQEQCRNAERELEINEAIEVEQKELTEAGR
jgi:hypothetical protein